MAIMANRHRKLARTEKREFGRKGSLCIAPKRPRDIMRQTGHKSSAMLAKYIRVDQMFTQNSAAGLGI